MVETIEAAWDLRMSDPQAALRLILPLCTHPDPLIRCRAQLTATYATLRTRGPTGAEAILADTVLPPDDPVSQGRRGLVEGVLHMARGRHLKAIHSFQLAAAILEAIGQPSEVAGAMINMATVHRRIGDTPRALAMLTEATARFRRLGDPYGEAAALINSAQLMHELGDLAAALPLARSAHRLAREMPRPGFLGFVQAQLGRMLAESGDRTAGITLLEEAVAIAEAAEVPKALSESLGHLGVVLAPEDPDRAAAVLDRAMSMVYDLGDPMTICLGLIALGDAAGDTDAYTHYAAAARVADENGEHRQAITAHRSAARAARDPVTELLHWRAFAAAVEEQQGRDHSNRLARLQASALLDELEARDTTTRQRIARLSAAARQRSDLLAITIHDLRNPLQVARGHAELLQFTSPAPGLDAIVQAMGRIEQIIQLVESDLNQRRVEAVVEDIQPLVLAIVRERRPSAEAKGQQIEVHGEPVSVPVYADRLFHAVDNLLGNAVKFSPHDARITVRVMATADGARIEVADQGPGLSETEAASIFARAFQGEAQPTGSERSSGMGLYIARRMVEHHGGRIGAAPGRDGALFWIDLPE